MLRTLLLSLSFVILCEGPFPLEETTPGAYTETYRLRAWLHVATLGTTLCSRAQQLIAWQLDF
jgi:hypothetical protein